MQPRPRIAQSVPQPAQPATLRAFEPAPPTRPAAPGRSPEAGRDLAHGPPIAPRVRLVGRRVVRGPRRTHSGVTQDRPRRRRQPVAGVERIEARRHPLAQRSQPHEPRRPVARRDVPRLCRAPLAHRRPLPHLFVRLVSPFVGQRVRDHVNLDRRSVHDAPPIGAETWTESVSGATPHFSQRTNATPSQPRSVEASSA